MRVLVTGAAGFIGKAVVEVLRREHEVRAFDLRPSSSDPATIVGDVADFQAVSHAVEGMDAVVHLAFLPMTPTSYNEPERPMHVNVQGAACVLEAARRARIRRVVHMSSGAVVTGYSRDTFIHVELPMKFSGMYCLTKALQEHLCRQYAVEYGMTIIALRPWSVVDAPTMTDCNGQPLRYDGGFLPFVCRYDLAEACRLGLCAELTGFQPFHTMVGAENERGFDLERTHRVLGWQPREHFEHLTRQAK